MATSSARLVDRQAPLSFPALELQMLCVPPHLTFYVSAKDPSSGPHASMLNKQFTDWEDSPASHVLLETSSLLLFYICP